MDFTRSGDPVRKGEEADREALRKTMPRCRFPKDDPLGGTFFQERTDREMIRFPTVACSRQQPHGLRKDGTRFLKIAHRGYSERYPENTILAFEQAIRSGTDMIELDVRLSKDGRIVVIHDDRIDRTSDGSGKVADMTLAELKRYSFNNGMTQYGFIGIPTLEETLDLVGERVALNIEIKERPDRQGAIEERLFALLRELGAEDRVIVSSFDVDVLRRMKRIAPVMRTAFIYDRVWFPFSETIRMLGVYSLHPSIKVMNADRLKWAKSCGLMVYPWVAKDRRTVEKCRASGFIDGVMVNDLELFQ